LSQDHQTLVDSAATYTLLCKVVWFTSQTSNDNALYWSGSSFLVCVINWDEN